MIKALTSWPLLLCGPVLRRVGFSEVNVFVALKHSRSVELKVFQGQAIVARGTASTLALGTYLHVTVVTAVPTSTQLESGRVYAYDLTFSPDAATDPLDTDRSAKSLASPGLAMTGSLLDGTLALGFAPGRLPSFALPPAELRDLGLVHASCRKPHAPGLDALPILDTVIRGLYTDAIKRPHQLFLTGDQIYADDVAEPLLEQLSAVGRMLLGWPADEALPPRNQGGAAPTEADIAPGRRNVALVPPLTSGAAQCHLIRLAEFYAMYLFVWSDALWPDPFEKRPVPTISPETGAVHPDAVEQARLLAQIAVVNAYNEQVDSVTAFGKSLGKVRRALANVPTYMIFDDHEVTDDWYLHRDQREALLDSPLATRLVTNALCAYSVFQGWGNEPGAYTPATAGGLFLSSLSQWRGETMGDAYNTLRNSVGTLNSGTPPALRFDYGVSGPAHDVIVMDTRTRRGYPPGSDLGAPDLVPAAELQIQITNRLPAIAVKPLTVLVSAAPVVGNPIVEWVQDVRSLISGGRTAAADDRETWLVPSRRQGFEALLQSLVPFGSVLMLSGDVHYGFTCSLRYWDERSAPNRRATFVQLVSSALKNQSGETHALAGTPLAAPSTVVAWDAPGYHIRDSIGIPLYADGIPAVKLLHRGQSPRDPPGWRYAVNWSLDDRPFGKRSGTPDFVASGAGWLAQQRALGQEHRRSAQNDQLRYIVGSNNLASIRFGVTKPNDAHQFILVEQSLWFRLAEDSDDALPYTVQMADLTPPTEGEPKPASTDGFPVQPSAARWQDLISFRPSKELQDGAEKRAFRFQPIESARGLFVNLDFYGIRVTQFPIVDGVRLDAKALLLAIRARLNDLVDTDYASFAPYEAKDAAPWAAADPLGAAVSIDIKIAGKSFFKGSGTVLVTDTADDHWTFSTAWSKRDWSHPVSGNRRFGFMADGASFIFYTQGADRTSNAMYSGSWFMVYAGGESLWQSFQKRVVAFVNDNAGAALADQPVSHRYFFDDVYQAYHRPTLPWSSYHHPV